MLTTIRNAFKIPELRKKLLYTAMMLVVIRFGSLLPVPGVDKTFIQMWFAQLAGAGDAFNFLDALTGGSFTNMSVFALSITPYITSSIIMQLLTIAIPKLEEMQKDGEDGRKKIAEYTRYVTVLLALIQSSAMAIGFGRQGLLTTYNFWSVIVAIAAMTAGSALLMWIGEQITQNGIGNGISLIISAVSGGALTLSSLITLILSVPVNFLTSTPGMFVVIALAQLCWFFGIHGTGVIFTVLMVPYITAYTTNAALAAAGQPLQFFPVFLMSANGIMGGAGNTMPFSLMGLKSKSKRIQAVSKASFVPGLFGINEPAIFGYPIMYNAILLIPFMLCPMVCSALLLVAWNLHWIAYPQGLILTTLPVVFQTFLTTLDWRNVIFAILMFPVCWLIWRPFYKIYEKQCIEEEAAAEAAELAAQNK